MLEILQLRSVDASQTAFAGKGVFVSERTIYKWKNMLNELLIAKDTTPLIGLLELSEQIEAHRVDHEAQDDTSSDEPATNYRAKWQKWKSALSSMMSSSFRLKKNTLLPPRTPTV